MSFKETVRLLHLELSHDQRYACGYLERQGQRFCVDFGTDNAVEKARDHWNSKRRSARKTGKQERVH